METQFFQAPKNWNLLKAVNHAVSIGLQWKLEDEELLIEDKLVPATFTIEGDGYFRGYQHPMIDWNGWKVPYFTKEVLREIEKELQQDEGKGFRETEQGFTYVAYDYDEDAVEVMPPQIIVVDGKELELYNAGCGLIWSETSEAELKGSTDLDKIMLSVDMAKPVSAKEFLKVNVFDKDVEPLGSDELAAILSLKIGEKWCGGLTADVKRVQDSDMVGQR